MQKYLFLNSTLDNSNKNNKIKNCINISNININKGRNYYTYVKRKCTNIKNNIQNNQNLTSLKDYNQVPRSQFDSYFDPQFKPALYKSVFSSRSMKNQTVPKITKINVEITTIPKIINEIKSPLRTLSNNNANKYTAVFNEKGEFMKRNNNDKIKLNSKDIFYKRVINTNKSYTSNNSFSKLAFGNLLKGM